MIKKFIFGISICCLLVLFMQKTAVAQKESYNTAQNHTLDFGAGFGLDYGGLLGVKMAYILPFPHVSVFGAAGYQLGGLGWNVGATVHLLAPNNQNVFRPNVKIMYGVNRATYIIGAEHYNNLYTGLTPGIGLEFMFGHQKSHGFDIDINYPIGSSDFENQIDRIENDPTIQDLMISPIAISIGYHHEF